MTDTNKNVEETPALDASDNVPHLTREPEVDIVPPPVSIHECSSCVPMPNWIDYPSSPESLNSSPTKPASKMGLQASTASEKDIKPINNGKPVAVVGSMSYQPEEIKDHLDVTPVRRRRRRSDHDIAEPSSGEAPRPLSFSSESLDITINTVKNDDDVGFHQEMSANIKKSFTELSDSGQWEVSETTTVKTEVNEKVVSPSKHANDNSNSSSSCSTRPSSDVIDGVDSPKKQKVTRYSIEEILENLEEKIPKLLKMDYTTSEPLTYLKFVKRRTNYTPDTTYRKMIATKMEELGIIELFIKMWYAVHDNEGDLLDSPVALLNIQQIMSTLWNTTDISPSLCYNLAENGVIELLIRDLLSPKLGPDALENDDLSYYIRGMLGILHNVVRHHGNDTREQFRKADAVNAMQLYLNCPNETVKIKVLLILSYIINEYENDIINADDKNIAFIIKILQSAVDSEGHFSKKYGYCASELLCGLNYLAANDSNKERIIDNGALPYYLQLICQDSTTEEQQYAARGIWTLAFNDRCKVIIKQAAGCLEALQLLERESNSDVVRHAARGALWEINASRRSSFDSSSDSSSVLSDTPHIMISYQWDSKPTMLKVKDQLKDAGFKVWMDEENMSGSCLEAMALAVERARVVLVTLSERYKASPNCRSEAEYAFKLRKDIVPLLLQPGYNADGWLGIMVGTRLYFNFAEERMFQDSMGRLVRELGDRGRIPLLSPECHLPGTRQWSIERKLDIICNTVTSWQADDIKQWLENIGLEQHTDKFTDYTGEIILEMQKMNKSAPSFLYQTLQQEYGLNLREVLMLSKGLGKLG